MGKERRTVRGDLTDEVSNVAAKHSSRTLSRGTKTLRQREYGFVEQTLGEDGDPIDVMILMSLSTFPGCIVRSRIVGLLEMRDENGIDNKILAVAADDPRMDHITRIQDVPSHTLKEIAHFFATYKDLEGGKESHVGGWRDAEEGERVLMESQERFAKTQH